MNPPVHMALVLGNLSRMERGEVWRIYSGFTPALSLMLQAIDDERLGLATAAGVDARTVQQHFSLTHDVPEQRRIDLICEDIHAIGRGSLAPTSMDTHYILEDVPFGLCATVALARKFGYAAPLHEAGVGLFDAIIGEKLIYRNDLLPALDFENISLDELRRLYQHGA